MAAGGMVVAVRAAAADRPFLPLLCHAASHSLSLDTLTATSTTTRLELSVAGGLLGWAG